MGIIIKVDEVKTVLCERGELPVQTFTFLDSEKRTMKVSIWGHMTVNQSPILIKAARNHSVVIAKRLAIKRFEGGTLNAKNRSSFAINPPRAATELKEWFESVQEIELSGWLADANDTIEISRKNVDSGIMKTHTVLEVVKAIESGDYWVRGYLQIAEEDQKLTYNACNSCTRSINIAEDRQYMCRYCNKEVLAIPKPMVLMSIRDHTGIINVATITTVAEKILQTIASEIARLNKLVPIDSCVIGAQSSAFLQQALYITGGVYLKPQQLDGLFQYLVVFLPQKHNRFGIHLLCLSINIL